MVHNGSPKPTAFQPEKIVWSNYVRQHPVMINYFNRIWHREPEVTLRFVSVVSMYLNIINLVESNSRVVTNFGKLINYYCRQISKMILAGANDEKILLESTSALDELIGFIINETGDKEAMNTYEKFTESFDRTTDLLHDLIKIFEE